MQAQERTFLKLIKDLSEVDRLMILAIAKVQWWHKTVNKPAISSAKEKPKTQQKKK